MKPTTGRATKGNLPAELTSFVGRRRELSEVKRLLATSRLVTLTGVGGTGKTRLALRVAAESRRAFADGVWFVDLTRLHDPGVPTLQVGDPDVLAFLVTATLGLREQARSPLSVLVDQLADRRMLLVLDNCEHLLPASAILSDALMRGCPELRMLVTSREPLTIAGELLFAVPPLPAPDPGRQPGPAELTRYESVALFLARAQAGVPGFALTEANHLAVARLCHRLDGLPLAIELAAARVRALEPQEILDRLADRFALLSRGNRAAPQRQQTLRACVDWSFDLCAKPERLLWARLSVFAGGFELDAVEGVCADEQLPEPDLLDLMAGLLDKSVLIRDDFHDGQGDSARYRMLETIRGYGQDKLREGGQDTVLRRRHRDWHLRLVARARAGWVSHRQPYGLARLTREHHNLRAAVEFCLMTPGEAEAALRLAVSLPGLYWPSSGVLIEGRRWLDRALAQVTAPTALRAQALLVDSFLASLSGDPAAGMRLLEEGEELARRLDAAAALAHAAFIRGTGALIANDLPGAVETLDAARTILAGTPEPDLDLYLNVLTALAVAAGLADDPGLAGTCVREMLSIVVPRGERLHRSYALWVGGLTAWRQGNLREAAAQELECLRLKRAWGSDDRYGTALSLEVLAWITTGQERHRRAAILLGAADALWTDVGTPVAAFGHLIGHHDACERRLRDALGGTAFAEAFRHGQALSYDEAIAYALGEPRQSTAASASAEDASALLTRREQEVAELIGRGLSNRDIAAALVISQRTAEGHVERILAKLGFTSRTQVAVWITGRDS